MSTTTDCGWGGVSVTPPNWMDSVHQAKKSALSPRTAVKGSQRFSRGREWSSAKHAGLGDRKSQRLGEDAAVDGSMMSRSVKTVGTQTETKDHIRAEVGGFSHGVVMHNGLKRRRFPVIARFFLQHRQPRTTDELLPLSIHNCNIPSCPTPQEISKLWAQNHYF